MKQSNRPLNTDRHIINPYQEIIKNLLPHDDLGNNNALHPHYLMNYRYQMCLKIPIKSVRSINKQDELKHVMSQIGKILSREILWNLFNQTWSIYHFTYEQIKTDTFNIKLYDTVADNHKHSPVEIIKNVKYNIFGVYKQGKTKEHNDEILEKTIHTYTHRTHDEMNFMRVFKYGENYYILFSERLLKHEPKTFQPGLLLKEEMENIPKLFIPITPDYRSSMIIETDNYVIFTYNGEFTPRLIKKSDNVLKQPINYSGLIRMIMRGDDIDSYRITTLNLSMVRVNNSEYRPLIEFILSDTQTTDIVSDVETINQFIIVSNNMNNNPKIQMIPMKDQSILRSEFEYRLIKIKSLLYRLSNLPISYLVGRVLMDKFIDWKPTCIDDIKALIKLKYITGDELLSTTSFRKLNTHQFSNEESKFVRCDPYLSIKSKSWTIPYDYYYHIDAVKKYNYIHEHINMTPDTYLTIMGVTMKLKDWDRL